MRILAYIVLITIPLCFYGQDTTTLYLQSWSKKGRISKIPKGQYIDIRFKLADTSLYTNPRPTLYSGDFLSAQFGRIRISVDNEELKSKNTAGTIAEFIVTYTPSDGVSGVDNSRLKFVNYKDIESISYMNQKPAGDVGFFIAGMSALTALVIAPLISVNYKTGDFNQSRYYKTLGGCAVGLAIGIPIGLIFTKDKTYHISQDKADPDGFTTYRITN